MMMVIPGQKEKDIELEKVDYFDKFSGKARVIVS